MAGTSYKNSSFPFGDEPSEGHSDVPADGFEEFTQSDFDFEQPHSAADDLLAELTDPQREAVQHVDGPLLILAGPGSGKTRVVTHRIAYLLQQGVRASQILALTFTNKAAGEMRSRVQMLAPGERVWTSTFHRFCARLLREHASLVGLEENFVIYDTADSRRLLRDTIQEVLGNTGMFTPESIAASISWNKNNLVSADVYEPRPGSPLAAVVADVFPHYQRRLLDCNAVDFDDLLLHVALMLRENSELRKSLDARYRYVMVDEYQDTNLAQYTIARALCIDYPNLAVTGDPDQSIYGWRGANLQNILSFEEDYPRVHVVKLEQNYRSTQRILEVADHLIQHNRRRKAKRLFTDNDAGKQVRFVQCGDQQAEAEMIAGYIAQEVQAGRRRLRDFAVFYRVNALSRELEHSFRSHGITYQIVNGLEFYQRREIKDLLAYLSLINNPRDDLAFLRIVNVPARGIGKTTLERLRAYAQDTGQSLLSAARSAAQVPDLGTRPVKKLQNFVMLMEHLVGLADSPVEEVLGHVLNDSDYRAQFGDLNSEDDQQRLANIEELLTAARQFDDRHDGHGTLESFLEDSCLVNDIDTWDDADDCVTLMTLHASKGLEFPVVFVMALEQGLIPHERSKEDADQLEEERRLLFVGLTRAEEELHLSLARRRDFRGVRKITIPSPFLQELPRESLEWVDLTESYVDPDAELIERARRQRRLGPGAFRESSGPQITTAAEMAGDQPSETSKPPANRLNPDEFYQGMRVKHPEYGLGKVVALSGIGRNRRATIAFVTPGIGERPFVLIHANLTPVGKGGG